MNAHRAFRRDENGYAIRLDVAVACRAGDSLEHAAAVCAAAFALGREEFPWFRLAMERSSVTLEIAVHDNVEDLGAYRERAKRRLKELLDAEGVPRP